jgi:hypothetical protein
MSASTGDLLTLLGGHDPVGVVFYRDDESLEGLLDLCEMFAPEGRPVYETAAIDDAFQPESKDEVLLITPTDEVEAVRTLEARREALLKREAPAVLFLMQDGSAEHVLNREAPAVWSFLGGLTYDPEAPPNEVDLADGRATFEQKHGRTADEWLEAWRRDEIEDTMNNNFTAHQAWALRKA